MTPDSTRLTVEGRLTGLWVNELEQEWQSTRQSREIPFLVDLTAVTYIAEDGKALLSRMWQEGAELIASGCCTRLIVEEITSLRRHKTSDRRRTK
jgi:hypothetical protein